jgi:hypothetical protein
VVGSRVLVGAKRQLDADVLVGVSLVRDGGFQTGEVLSASQ